MRTQDTCRRLFCQSQCASQRQLPPPFAQCSLAHTGRCGGVIKHHNALLWSTTTAQPFAQIVAPCNAFWLCYLLELCTRRDGSGFRRPSLRPVFMRDLHQC